MFFKINFVAVLRLIRLVYLIFVRLTIILILFESELFVDWGGFYENSGGIL